ncbi:MAG: hypothetical protein JST68_19185 [Bacteroidetes bacterium]|nr:hypothetical protein [Bacteroidota bacterium]
MIFKPYSNQNYSSVLKKGGASDYDYPFLPAGNFIYRFSIRNPSTDAFELVMKISDAQGNSEEHTFESNQLFIREEVNIKKSSDNFNSPLRVSFLLKKGAELDIQLPVSLIMTSSVKEKKQNYLSTVNRVKNAFSEQLKLAGAGNASSNSLFNADVQARLLSFKQAESQLDYVIYHKLFVPDGSRGLLKAKRAFYRRMLRFIYRRLTKNTVRKEYIVKIYRNYVNLNTLFEN